MIDGFMGYDFAEQRCGVYILALKGEVVYVGKSIRVYNRVEDHYRLRKIKFDRCYIRLCTLAEMNGLEFETIKRCKPIHNKKDLGSGMDIGPIDLVALGLAR